MTRKGAASQPPMPAGWLPVIGHLHQLSSKSQVLKETFSCWHEEYGPALMLQLGLGQVLVVSSWEMAKECFTTNDLAFSNQPLSAVAKYLADDGYMFPVAAYGDHWHEMRKIAVEEMLSNRALRSFADMRASEINAKVSEAYRLWLANDQQPVKVDMRKLLEELTFNVAAWTVAGEDCTVSRGGNDVKAHEFCSMQQGVFVASDFFPFLEVLDIKGWVSTMKRVARELDAYIGQSVEEHRQRRKFTSNYRSHDFIDMLLSHFDDDEGANRAIKSGVTKVQEELDHHVGKERIVNESDLKNLVYLEAAVKESLCLSPTTPLLALRESKEDCQVCGFYVPAGIRLMVNLGVSTRAVSRKQRGCAWEALPFSPVRIGSEICPGISFALRIVHIVLARLLQGFDMKLLPDDSSFDDDNPLGLDTSLNVLLAPRLPQALHG
ncbi:Ent-kaurene oxidase-like protein 1 [Nymphaea thermarum]|nr:Ent-kaurene oxidase-like protein 1 [Nymphaea thermarum]